MSWWGAYFARPWQDSNLRTRLRSLGSVRCVCPGYAAAAGANHVAFPQSSRRWWSAESDPVRFGSRAGWYCDGSSRRSGPAEGCGVGAKLGLLAAIPVLAMAEPPPDDERCYAMY
jgi:hypothetical protein